MAAAACRPHIGNSLEAKVSKCSKPGPKEVSVEENKNQQQLAPSEIGSSVGMYSLGFTKRNTSGKHTVIRVDRRKAGGKQQDVSGSMGKLRRHASDLSFESCVMPSSRTGTTVLSRYCRVGRARSSS